MTVTQIVEYSTNKYKIYLNDEFAFVLYKGELRHYGINEGTELSDEVIDEIYSKVLTKRARLRAMHLLEKRDYTEKTMRDKLREGLYPENVIDDAIEYVVSYHYIDDERYAYSFINSHISSLSRRQITDKLRQKGISDDVICNCIEEYLDDNDDSFDDRLVKMMRKNLSGFDITQMDYKEKQKLFAKYYRKGYSIEMIEKAFRKCEEYGEEYGEE